MPVAKEILRDGFVVVALPGTYVSKSAVEQFGWQDKVEDGPDLGGETAAAAAETKRSKKAQ